MQRGSKRGRGRGGYPLITSVQPPAQPPLKLMITMPKVNPPPASLSPPSDPRLRNATSPQPIVRQNKAPSSLGALIGEDEGDDSGENQPLPITQSQSSVMSEHERDGSDDDQPQPAPGTKKEQCRLTLAPEAYEPDEVAKAIALLENARTRELKIRELEFKCGGLLRANGCLKFQIETLNYEVEWLTQDVCVRGKRLRNAQNLLKKVLFGEDYEEPICKRRKKVSNECPF